MLSILCFVQSRHMPRYFQLFLRFSRQSKFYFVSIERSIVYEHLNSNVQHDDLHKFKKKKITLQHSTSQSTSQ